MSNAIIEGVQKLTQTRYRGYVEVRCTCPMTGVDGDEDGDEDEIDEVYGSCEVIHRWQSQKVHATYEEAEAYVRTFLPMIEELAYKHIGAMTINEKKPKELETLEACHQAVTPGRWYLASRSGGRWHGGDPVGVAYTDWAIHVNEDTLNSRHDPLVAEGMTESDARFFLRAHETIPLLIGEIRRLRAELAHSLEGPDRPGEKAGVAAYRRGWWREIDRHDAYIEEKCGIFAQTYAEMREVLEMYATEPPPPPGRHESGLKNGCLCRRCRRDRILDATKKGTYKP